VVESWEIFSIAFFFISDSSQPPFHISVSRDKIRHTSSSFLSYLRVGRILKRRTPPSFWTCFGFFVSLFPQADRKRLQRQPTLSSITEEAASPKEIRPPIMRARRRLWDRPPPLLRSLSQRRKSWAGWKKPLFLLKTIFHFSSSLWRA